MLKNYIKTAIRNLLKNKLTSFINIVGLAIAIGCVMVVYVYVSWEFSKDKFHVNSDRIFLLKNEINRDGNKQVWGFTPAPLGAMLKQDFPQIENIVRIDGRSGIFRHDDKVFNEFIRFTDPVFLEVFSFPLKWGENDALYDKSKIVLSENIAIKYFGEENPVGKQITITFGSQNPESFEVGAVFDKFPNTASFAFGILANYEKIKVAEPEYDFDDWKDFISATFIQMKDPKDTSIVSSKMDKYVALQNAARHDWPSESYTFEPLTTLSINSYKIRSSISSGDEPTGRIVLSILGIFMLTLACFNYINIAVVSATRRLKEIGIRKVIGGNKKQLVFQFLSENLVITLFSLILGVGFGYFMFVPWFDQLFSIGLEFNLFSDPQLWIFLLAILLITGLVSGAYPAFYVSSFHAVEIFRGKQKFGSKNLFSKFFLTFQFILSFILIVGGLMFIQNGNYQKKRDWGYNQEQTLVIPVPDHAAYTQIKNVILQNPDITSVAGSRNHLGRSAGLVAVEILSKNHEFRIIDVGEDYLETMGLRLKEGRFFDKNLATDIDQSVIVNQTLVENMGWNNPIGETMIYDSTLYSVIGVLEDFHYFSFWNEIEPVFMRFTEEENYRYLSAKVKPGSITKTSEYLADTWKEYYPDLPYNGFFQDQVFQNYFDNITGHGKLMGFNATLAIILSCMGLFGLVSLKVNSKMKEFSIRKVLGAGISHLINGVNRQFLWVLIIASIIGGPLSLFLTKTLFESVYTYYMPITVIPVLYSGVLLFFTAAITVSSQIYKVIVTNPVDSLRDE